MRVVVLTRRTFHYFLMVARAPVTCHTCTTSVYVLCVLRLHVSGKIHPSGTPNITQETLVAMLNYSLKYYLQNVYKPTT